jgi:hypothetical protein
MCTVTRLYNHTLVHSYTPTLTHPPMHSIPDGTPTHFHTQPLTHSLPPTSTPNHSPTHSHPLPPTSTPNHSPTHSHSLPPTPTHSHPLPHPLPPTHHPPTPTPLPTYATGDQMKQRGEDLRRLHTAGFVTEFGAVSDKPTGLAQVQQVRGSLRFLWQEHSSIESSHQRH